MKFDSSLFKQIKICPICSSSLSLMIPLRVEFSLPGHDDDDRALFVCPSCDCFVHFEYDAFVERYEWTFSDDSAASFSVSVVVQ